MKHKFRFQPLVRLSNHSILGYEALCVKASDNKFPSAVEILKEVFSGWSISSDSLMFINMTLEDVVSTDFCHAFLEVIDSMDVNANSIVLEVNENTKPEMLTAAKKTLSLLRANGIKIALDDFGVQYASIDYMSELPLDIIKIDQKFIQAAPADKKIRSILKHITAIAHDMGCSVVAEGIENSLQLECAKNISADIGQGFLFSAPLSNIESKRFFDLNELYLYLPKAQTAVQALGY
ncbi:MAG: EAL domain-containing protein [Alphaproteobacteria bacterium]|nr:EAL domain-containing protein [Alphaproteobacteria bacterium]